MAAGGLLRREPDDSLGTRAERHVFERLRAALPPEYTMLSNIAWLVRDHGVEREGEADLVIAHPERGFLAIEVKAGQIRRDSHGSLVGGRRPARPIAVPAGGRQPPQPRRQAQGAARPGRRGSTRSPATPSRSRTSTWPASTPRS